MPQKACVGGFSRVMAFPFLFDMLQNRRIIFSVLFENRPHAIYSEYLIFCMFEICEMPHFSHLILKIGHFKYFEHIESGVFQIKTCDRFSHSKKIEN